MVIRDRRNLSEFGVIVPIVTIDRRTGKMVNEPEIISRGFVVSEGGEEMIDTARAIVTETIQSSSKEEAADVGMMEEKIRTDLRKFLSRRTARSSRPLITPVVLEV
jgi:ribonuclease J